MPVIHAAARFSIPFLPLVSQPPQSPARRGRVAPRGLASTRVRLSNWIKSNRVDGRRTRSVLARKNVVPLRFLRKRLASSAQTGYR